MLRRLIEVVKDEDGATMVEYALMVALIAVVCIAAVKLVGTAVQGSFTKTEGALNGQ